MKNNTNHQELRIIKLQKKKKCFDGVSLKGYVASYVDFRFGARNKRKALLEYPVTNDA